MAGIGDDMASSLAHWVATRLRHCTVVAYRSRCSFFLLSAFAAFSLAAGVQADESSQPVSGRSAEASRPATSEAATIGGGEGAACAIGGDSTPAGESGRGGGRRLVRLHIRSIMLCFAPLAG